MVTYNRLASHQAGAGEANIDGRGQSATAKGLRHGFGVAGVQSNVPLNMIQKWLGHANINTTTIYTDAVGEEERDLAARLWQRNGAKT